MIENTNQQTEVTLMTGLQKFMQSHTAKFIVIGIIILILLIPLYQVKMLINERGVRQQKVENQIAHEWGVAIEYHGIVMKIPYTISKDPKAKKKADVYLIPENSKDDIQTKVSEKHRSIFKVNIYSAKIQSKTFFDLQWLKDNPDYSDLDLEAAQLVFISNSDIDIKEISSFKIGNKAIQIEGQRKQAKYPYLLETFSQQFDVSAILSTPFDVNLKADLNGTSEFIYAPFAKKSNASMQSNWSNPSFVGSNLPIPGSSKINTKGFEAEWRNLDMSAQMNKTLSTLASLRPKKSGVRFINVIDQYSLNERTAKYGALVFVLTFAVFFLIQIVEKIRIHAIHYLLVGLSLVLFYSLLLSFSEHLGFTTSYLIAAATIILLLIWYAKSILNSFKFAVLVGLSLSLTYGFILVLVNLETYALLFGSIGLLIVLTAIMSVTRKLKLD